MEFREVVIITLYARQQKRHRCIEQSFGLCGIGRGWDGLGEWHWNMYIIICEWITSPCLMHDTGFSGLVHWDDPEVWDGEGWDEMSDGEHMYTKVDSCQCMAKPIQYWKVISLQKKKKRHYLQKNNNNKIGLRMGVCPQVFIWFLLYICFEPFAWGLSKVN